MLRHPRIIFKFWHLFLFVHHLMHSARSVKCLWQFLSKIKKVGISLTGHISLSFSELSFLLSICYLVKNFPTTTSSPEPPSPGLLPQSSPATALLSQQASYAAEPSSPSQQSPSGAPK